MLRPRWRHWHNIPSIRSVPSNVGPISFSAPSPPPQSHLDSLAIFSVSFCIALIVSSLASMSSRSAFTCNVLSVPVPAATQLLPVHVSGLAFKSSETPHTAASLELASSCFHSPFPSLAFEIESCLCVSMWLLRSSSCSQTLSLCIDMHMALPIENAYHDVCRSRSEQAEWVTCGRSGGPWPGGARGRAAWRVRGWRRETWLEGRDSSQIEGSEELGRYCFNCQCGRATGEAKKLEWTSRWIGRNVMMGESNKLLPRGPMSIDVKKPAGLGSPNVLAMNRTHWH